MVVILPERPFGIDGILRETTYPEGVTGERFGEKVIIATAIGVEHHSISQEIKVFNHFRETLIYEVGGDSGISSFFHINDQTHLRTPMTYGFKKINGLLHTIFIKSKEMIDASFDSRFSSLLIVCSEIPVFEITPFGGLNENKFYSTLPDFFEVDISVMGRYVNAPDRKSVGVDIWWGGDELMISPESCENEQAAHQHKPSGHQYIFPWTIC